MLDKDRIKALEKEIGRLTSELSDAYKELALVYELSLKMAPLLDTAAIADILLIKGMGLLEAGVGVVILFNTDGEVTFRSSKGIEEGRILGIERYRPDTIEDDLSKALGVKDPLIVPIALKEKRIGILCFGKKEGGRKFSLLDKRLASALATQSAGMFMSSSLYLKLESLLLKTIRALIRAIEEREPYLVGHSERVARIGVGIAQELGLSEKEKRNLEMASLLHDIGKMSIERKILEKPGRLTEEEWKVVREHPKKSLFVIEDIGELREIFSALLHHHERYEGKGYPNGIKGEEIPLLSRIIAVADTFDAMTSDRPYRMRYTEEGTIREIKACSGSQFDPKVVEAFLRLREHRPDLFSKEEV
jgi:HD-GYP domain-containing protein (c-di-GMP phosphodiesterase class II)